MPLCDLCGKPCENLEHPLSPNGYGCESCFERCTRAVRDLVDDARREQERRERLRCEGCGAAWGTGCSCSSNKLAIGRGERAKAVSGA